MSNWVRKCIEAAIIAIQSGYRQPTYEDLQIVAKLHQLLEE